MRCTISWSLLGTVYLSRDKDGIGWWKVFAGVCPWMSIAAPLLRGKLYLVIDTAEEKEFEVAI